MRMDFQMAWQAQNQAALAAEFARLRARLDGVTPADDPAPVTTAMEPPPAIDVLTSTFGLSAFERDLLLLCAGVEMESALGDRCAEMAGRAQHRCVTFGLAMGLLAEPHWSALSPTAPLRRFRLIEMESGQGLTAAPLRIDERILHYLAGVNRVDPRLEAVLQAKAPPRLMAEAHRRLAMEMIVELPGAESALHFCGDDAQGQEGVAALIAGRGGRGLFVLRAPDIPAPGGEMDTFLALWAREALLLPALLLLQLEHETPTPAALQLAERLQGPLLIASRGPLRLHRRLVEQFDIDRAPPADQKRLWEGALEPLADGAAETTDRVAEQFRLSAETIDALGAATKSATPKLDTDRLWNACRAVSRPRLEALAERIVPAADWADLVLPPLQTQTLRQLAAQSRNRMTVYERWGFAARGRRGLGLSALFTGPSGTGKTLAAEVLAADLHLDMYRIDLSAVVSKYIGETEKNLRLVFDAAESGGTLLLFDEADALFGKRTEVKDSHDRYANIEVGYLLQRMESFQGLAILTSNVKTALDKAFQRRLRFSVDFPFPSPAEREAIWSRAFPGRAPTEGLDPSRLSSLNMAGGSIRNIALNAAFLAAEENVPVRMTHLLQATQLEAAKAERPISDAEIRGWL